MSSVTSSTTAPNGFRSRSRGSAACWRRRYDAADHAGVRRRRPPRARRPALGARRPPGPRRGRDPGAAAGGRVDHGRARPRRRDRPVAPGPPRRLVRGSHRGRRAAAPLPARGRLRRRARVHDSRPVRVLADARRARSAPDRRGPPRAALRPARGPRPRARRRRRHRVRGMGAGRPRGQRDRRLQLVGRPAARDALARRERHLGAVPAGDRAGRALQVRDPHPDRRAAAEGRPVRARDRGPTAERVGRVQVDLRVGRRGVHRGTPRRAAAGAADVDLRGPPRLVAAELARGQPQADVRRARRRAVGVRERRWASRTSSCCP